VHGKDDLDSIVRMLKALKDHIWTQLGLGYTIKQIYYKHKAIWQARINAWESMIRDDFIKQQDIVYLDHKHKRVRELTFTQKFNHFFSHMGI
jgi:hypothetical protein